MLTLFFRAPAEWLRRRRAEEASDSLLSRLLLPFSFMGYVLNSAFSGTRNPFQRLFGYLFQRRRDVGLAVPSIFGIIGIGFVIFSAIFSNTNVVNKYRSKARMAMASQNFDRAKVYVSRVINSSAAPSPEDRFVLAQALVGSGETERASTIMKNLAPADDVGYAPAHRLLAINLAASLQQQQTNPELLQQLRWHLDHAQDAASHQINQVWAFYYMAVQQPENAVTFMRRAAENSPALFLSAGDIYLSNNDAVTSRQMFGHAKKAFQKSVQKNPHDLQQRVLLARAHVKLGEISEAEETLKAGVRMDPTPEFKRALAEFYVLRHDIAVRDGSEFDVKFTALQQALQNDAEYIPTYERLIRQYKATEDQSNSGEIKTALELAIASGEAASLGHFAIGNLYWVDKDFAQAEWHIQQAYRLDSRLSVVGNNLAWLLAHREDNPELEQAESLIRSVVKQFPDDPRFRDTLGTILQKKGEHEAALVEFEKVLPLIANKKPVHVKLSVIYRDLGNDRLSKLHSELSEQP